MIKKLSVFLIVVFVLSGVLYGCGKSSVKVQNQNTQAKADEPKKEETKADEPKKDDSKKDDPAKVQNDIFVIYKADENTYAKVVNQQINISDDKSMEEKLALIAQKLSEVEFSNLPIEVLKLEDINGKKIAQVNLKEDSKNNKGWLKSYLQGSAGGSITTVSLSETFLQKDYKGQWIDGVEFLYNGKKCDFENAPDLSDIFYRK